MIGVDNCDGQQNALRGGDLMNPIELIKEILATYEKHDWRLRRVLLRPETRAKRLVTLIDCCARGEKIPGYDWQKKP